MAIFRRGNRDNDSARHGRHGRVDDDATAPDAGLDTSSATSSDVSGIPVMGDPANDPANDPAKDPANDGDGADPANDEDGAETASDAPASDDGAGTGDGGSIVHERPRRTGPIDRANGPFDRSEIDGPEGRLDLGALWLAGRPGMELRLEMDQESQAITAVTAVVGESAIQFQAFAAPKSSDLWDDIRDEIADSIIAQGGTADEAEGALGIELQARMPARGPDGRTVFSAVRFLGVDGPRWFLRAVISGPAAVDRDVSADLVELVRATVVVRGDEAMAPRELLGLRLPDEAAPVPDGEGADDADHADDDRADDDRADDDLKPFERGPEITELH